MDINIYKIQLAELAKKYQLKFVILHGSFATGTARKDSDLDIAAVTLGEDLDFDRLLKLCGEMADVFHLPPQTDLDFKTLNKVDPLFRYEVTRVGKLLFGDPADYEDFKAFSLRAYEDARPLLDLEHHLAHKFQVHLNKIYA
jgi:uncharacterized protein